jgi:hypothetical protein
MVKSSRKTRDQCLGVLSNSHAERFLSDLANLSPARIQGLRARYAEMFAGDRISTETMMVMLGRLLQRAWDAPDERRRDWYCHEIEAYYHKVQVDQELVDKIGDPSLANGLLGPYLEPGSPLWNLRKVEPPVEPTALEAALFYFRRNGDRARHCPTAGCPAPYFFSTKKGQKYCSPKCVIPAVRAAKSRWWTRNRAKEPVN